MRKLNNFDKVLGILIVIAILLLATKAIALGEDRQRTCLAENIYFEAGNQPFSGKLAVANVVLNRVESSQFPNTICEVVKQTKKYRESWRTGELIPVRGQCQFTWFCDGKPDEPKDSNTLLESFRVADIAMTNEIDITNGALFYHADYSNPYWSDNLERLVQIETHIFYK
jgi:spore germination cell wall hydrolase CwlJ-like protein